MPSACQQEWAETVAVFRNYVGSDRCTECGYAQKDTSGLIIAQSEAAQYKGCSNQNDSVACHAACVGQLKRNDLPRKQRLPE